MSHQEEVEVMDRNTSTEGGVTSRIFFSSPPIEDHATLEESGDVRDRTKTFMNSDIFYWAADALRVKRFNAQNSKLVTVMAFPLLVAFGKNKYGELRGLSRSAILLTIKDLDNFVKTLTPLARTYFSIIKNPQNRGSQELFEICPNLDGFKIMAEICQKDESAVIKIYRSYNPSMIKDPKYRKKENGSPPNKWL